MYIDINNTHYPCTCDARRIWPARFTGDVPSAVSGVITLCADDGFVLREDDCADWLRVVLDGNSLTLTNEPEPEPTQTEPEPAPTETEQLRADVDYIAVMTGVAL